MSLSTARWSLRLPRTQLLRNATTRVIQGRVERRVLIARADQRRWIQKPPPRDRPWASLPRTENEENQHHVQQDQAQQQQPGRNSQPAATLASSDTDTSDLVSEVHIPNDPNGVLPPDHPALSILGNSSLVIQRQLEMMNIIIGFEQANRYVIMDGQGQTIGYIAEQDHGIGRSMMRQFAKTHRSFTTHIFDRYEREVLRIHRPFAYINSRIRIYDCVPEGGYQETEASTALQGTSTSSVVNQAALAQVSPLKLDEVRIIGEAQQQWAPLRRKYNLFSYRPIESAREGATPRIESGERAASETTALTESKVPDAQIEAGMVQFAHVNEPFLSWDFTLRGEDQKVMGSVNRNFAGFAREIFTDTGVYALRMDSAAQSSALETAQGQEVQTYRRDATAMTLDQRAVMLATAVSIDFDYFSRHSSHASGGGFMPIWFPGMGAGTGAAGTEAGAVGAAEGAGSMEGAASVGGRGLGASEGAVAGAGSMAGYEAMQRGVYGPRGGDDASPTSNEPFPGTAGQSPEQMENQPGQDDVWGESQDPWGKGGGDGGWVNDGPSPPSAGEGGGSGGWMDSISDFFGE